MTSRFRFKYCVRCLINSNSLETVFRQHLKLQARLPPSPGSGLWSSPKRWGWVRAHFPKQRLVIEPTQAISVSICLRFGYFSDLWCEREVCLLAGEGCYSFDGEKRVCRFVGFVVILMDFKGAVSLAEFFFCLFRHQNMLKGFIS